MQFVLAFMLLLCTATISRPTQSLRANTTSQYIHDSASHKEKWESTSHVFKEGIPMLSTRDDVFRHSRMSSDYLHDVVFVIQQRNMDKLTDILHDVSDPSSINYGKHMTREGVAEMTSNPVAREAVLTYLRKSGASIISETLSGEYITSRAPIKIWENFFNCEFFLFHFTQHDGEVSKVVRAESYSIPIALAPHVNSVFNTVQMPHQPMDGSRINLRQTKSTEHLEGVENYITPAILRAAYNVGSKQGTSSSTQCAYATIDQYYSPSDLAKFQSSFQLASQPVVNSIGGHASDAICSSTPSQCAEANLDVQYLMAMSPVSPTTFWYSDYNSGFSGWLVSIANMVSPPMVFSISYGIEETRITDSELDAFDKQAVKLGAMGVTLVAASGDDGAISRRARITPSTCFYAPNFPASSPYVTAVGATVGVEASSPEVACQANAKTGVTITSGGGFSTRFPQPKYQKKAVAAYFTAAAKAGQTPVAGYNAAGRGFPDVAVAGSNYKIYIGGQSFSVSGTSASAPVVAGLISNLNAVRLASGRGPMGFINPALYRNSSLFINDITSGNNKCAAISKNVVNCCNQGYTCTTGWDPVTGLGSINYGNFEQRYAQYGEIPSSYASAGRSAACGISPQGASLIAVGAIMMATSWITLF